MDQLVVEVGHGQVDIRRQVDVKDGGAQKVGDQIGGDGPQEEGEIQLEKPPFMAAHQPRRLLHAGDGPLVRVVHQHHDRHGEHQAQDDAGDHQEDAAQGHRQARQQANGDGLEGHLEAVHQIPHGGVLLAALKEDMVGVARRQRQGDHRHQHRQQRPHQAPSGEKFHGRGDGGVNLVQDGLELLRVVQRVPHLAGVGVHQLVYRPAVGVGAGELAGKIVDEVARHDIDGGHQQYGEHPLAETRPGAELQLTGIGKHQKNPFHESVCTTFL